MDRIMSPGTNAAQNSKRMKLLLTALFLLCIAAGFLGCSAAEENDADDTPVQVAVDAPSTVSASNTSGLSLTVEKKEYVSSDAKIAYSLENSTDTEYTFDASTVSIEALRDGEWHRLAFRTDQENLGFYSEGCVVTPHSVWTGVESFYFYGDLVPAGTYRLVIGLTPGSDVDPSTIEYLAAEFSIVE